MESDIAFKTGMDPNLWGLGGFQQGCRHNAFIEEVVEDTASYLNTLSDGSVKSSLEMLEFITQNIKEGELNESNISHRRSHSSTVLDISQETSMTRSISDKDKMRSFKSKNRSNSLFSPKRRNSKSEAITNIFKRMSFTRDSGKICLMEPSDIKCSWSELLEKSLNSSIGSKNKRIESLLELSRISGFSESSLIDCLVRHMDDSLCSCNPSGNKYSDNNCAIAMLKSLRMNGLIPKLFSSLEEPSTQHYALAVLVRLNNISTWKCLTVCGDFIVRNIIKEIEDFFQDGTILATQSSVSTIINLMTSFGGFKSNTKELDWKRLPKIQYFDLFYVLLAVFYHSDHSNTLSDFAQVFSCLSNRDENLVQFYFHRLETIPSIMSLLLDIESRSSVECSDSIQTIRSHLINLISSILFQCLILEKSPESSIVHLKYCYSKCVFRAESYEDLGAQITAGLVMKCSNLPVSCTESSPFFSNIFHLLDFIWEKLDFEKYSSEVVVKAVSIMICVHLYEKSFFFVFQRARSDTNECSRTANIFQTRLQQRLGFFLDLAELIGILKKPNTLLGTLEQSRQLTEEIEMLLLRIIKGKKMMKLQTSTSEIKSRLYKFFTD